MNESDYTLNEKIIRHIWDLISENEATKHKLLDLLELSNEVRGRKYDELDKDGKLIEESNKYKAELIEKGEELYNKETDQGIKWQLYYTDKEYLKYYWRKGKCKVKNKSVYRFDATRGIKGNKGKLKLIDELDYLKFKKN